jgi:hypothetical protein
MNWRTNDNKGHVKLILEDGQEIMLNCDSAQELAALAAILSKSSVTYRTEDGFLFTDMESV